MAQSQCKEQMSVREVSPLDPRLMFSQDVDTARTDDESEDLFCKRCAAKEGKILRYLEGSSRRDHYKILCDVGVKSTFRCLKTFLKDKMLHKLPHKHLDPTEEIHYLVAQLSARSTEAAPKDLALHLKALLESKSSNLKKKVVNRRQNKIQRKQANQQTIFVEKVLYQTN